MTLFLWQELEQVQRKYQSQKMDTGTSKVYSSGLVAGAKATGIMAEAIIVASFASPNITPAQTKQRLLMVTSGFEAQSALYGVDVSEKVHPILLSQATRYLREH